MQREAIQAIDEKLLKMGKLDLLKGQPAYLADKSKKRKKPHETDQGENTTEHTGKVKKPRKPRKPRDIAAVQTGPSQPWRVLLSTIDSGPNVLGPLLPTEPLRLPKKAKISTFSAFASTADDACPLCGGPKHSLPDCPVPKGGIEK